VPTTITAQAGSQLTIVMDNQDAGVSHNLTVRGFGLANGETCAGPCTTTVTFTVPAAGTYKFICTVHSFSMIGDLVVQ
jgi:plastocyanin